jgi:hypothetical protein
MLHMPILSAKDACLFGQLTRSRLPLKPSSARKGPLTNSLYLACTANRASTYALGSCSSAKTRRTESGDLPRPLAFLPL